MTEVYDGGRIPTCRYNGTRPTTTHPFLTVGDGARCHDDDEVCVRHDGSTEHEARARLAGRDAAVDGDVAVHHGPDLEGGAIERTRLRCTQTQWDLSASDSTAQRPLTMLVRLFMMAPREVPIGPVTMCSTVQKLGGESP